MLPRMPGLELPRAHLAYLYDLGSRLIDSRRPGTDNEAVARSMLASFFDVCLRIGQDQLLAELDPSQPPSDRSELADHPRYLPALVAQLDTIDLDGGSPRNTKVKQLGDAIVTALGLAVVDAADRSIALDDKLRVAAHAAILDVATNALSVPQIRDSIIARARAVCEPRFLGAFDKVAAQLDHNGMRLAKIPKVPIDALHAVQRLLADVRDSLIDEVGRAAIDRAKTIIEAASADAAARIDAPISLRLTPRDVAIGRAQDPNVPKAPAMVATTLLAAITELVPIAWRAPERVARPYAATQVFAVGELIEHPKFGLGTVKSVAAQRIEVEFTDGPHTLVHRK
jgi:hypothetical protein